ncbi:S-adenosyl-L-methionine-dependent methyltransferase [Biscogniauxia mediterranea]|nr:S-adenosyl-L-methionine-dependent methyltransferase [Biscogniauxia mediterranea]
MPALTKAQKKQAQAAEDSFHRTYAAQYGEERWQQTLYPALVAPTRYATLINRYATSDIPEAFSEDEAKGLRSIPFLSPNHDGESARAATGPGPSLLAYQSDATTPFPPPQPHPSRRLMTHWNLDAASLLAVAVLDPRPGDKVLDLCAAPGGKSVAVSQLLRPCDLDDSESSSSPSLAGGCLHSNEVNPARNKRLASNLAAYLPPALFASGEVKVLRFDAAASPAAASAALLPLGPGGYDKVLLDAPCSSERHVLHHHHASTASSWRSGQSRKAAKAQAALLATALRAVRPRGGRVLYATCSLSAEENDGVVARGLEVAAKERKKGGGSGWDVAVRSGDLALEAWAERTEHGWLVLPDHPGGGAWGPLYFALLEKVAV